MAALCCCPRPLWETSAPFPTGTAPRALGQRRGHLSGLPVAPEPPARWAHSPSCSPQPCDPSSRSWPSVATPSSRRTPTCPEKSPPHRGHCPLAPPKGDPRAPAPPGRRMPAAPQWSPSGLEPREAPGTGARVQRGRGLAAGRRLRGTLSRSHPCFCRRGICCPRRGRGGHGTDSAPAHQPQGQLPRGRSHS